MSGSIGWGIIGPGIIAHKFADALHQIDQCHLVSVASKTPGKAAKFAREQQCDHNEDYQTLVQRNDIDIIYIATTHNFHYENAMLALEHGKHLLIEKPFTVNAEQAKEIIQKAKQKELFVMEALWVRFLPTMQKLKSLLQDGHIGEVKAFNVSFGGYAPEQYLPRIVNPDLAGGVTLDMGIYPITFINFLLDRLPIEHKSFARMSNLGVDEIATYLFRYQNECLATVVTSFNLKTKFEALIYGSKGYIEFPSFQEGNEFHIYQHDGTRDIKSCQTIKCDQNKNGFVYQIEEVHRKLRKSEKESSVISLDETLQTMELMDAMRKDWNLQYPFETR